MNAEKSIPTLSIIEFNRFRSLFQQKLGIHLPDVKSSLVSTRLWKRLRHHKLNSYSEYYELINAAGHEKELNLALDIITTNETYFFRDPVHFNFLRDSVLPGLARQEKVRLWSAACSTGEEVYTLAMVLADKHRGHWEIHASDINQSVLEKAHRAIYLDQRTENIPLDYRRRFCRKGIGAYENHLRIEPSLRSRVKFQRLALHESLPEIGAFDVIFLRNVMIYFDLDVRTDVVARICKLLKPEAYLFVGLSESLRDLEHGLQQIQPGIYRSRARG